jgi:hypothetical protein
MKPQETLCESCCDARKREWGLGAARAASSSLRRGKIERELKGGESRNLRFFRPLSPQSV